MVLRSVRAAAVVAAAAIALSACTAPESGDSTDAPASSAADTTTAPAESQDATEAPAGPEVQSTTGAVVEGMPEVIVPMPDAEIVSSSVQPAGDGQPVGVSIKIGRAHV